MQRVEVERAEPLADAGQLGHPLRPRRARVGLVEAADVDDLLPELPVGGVRVELRMHEPRPAWRRRGDARPVRRARVHHRADLGEARHAVAAGAPRVEVVERARRGRPSSAMRAAPISPSSSRRCPHHGGHVAERVLGRVLDARALDQRVERPDVDEARAAPVRRLGDRARDVLLARLRSTATTWSGWTLAAKPTTSSASSSIGGWKSFTAARAYPRPATPTPATRS